MENTSSPLSPRPLYPNANIAGRHFSSYAGTATSNEEYIINSDSITKYQVDIIIEYKEKIENLLDFLKKNSGESRNNLNILQFIKFIPKYMQNRLEDIRLNKNKKELLDFIECEYEKYQNKSDDFKEFEENSIKINCQETDFILDVFYKINDKISEIEDKYKNLPSFNEILFKVLDAIITFCAGIMVYSIEASLCIAPWITGIFFGILCIVLFNKLFVYYGQYTSAEDNQENKSNEWFASIRTYMPENAVNVFTKQLINKLKEEESTSNSCVSSRSSSPVAMRWVDYARFHGGRRISSPAIPSLDSGPNYPRRRPPLLRSPSLNILGTNNLNDVYARRNPCVPRDDLISTWRNSTLYVRRRVNSLA